MKDAESDSISRPELRKALGLRDLVLLNVSCVVGLYTLAQAAQFGWSSIPIWIVGILCYLIPSALMVVDLNARMPEEGGFYLWTKRAFGEWHGFVAAWTYWMSNIVWIPTVLFTASLVFLYVFGDRWLELIDNPWYTGVFALTILWFAIVLNIYGLKLGKWIQNIGGISIWITIILLFLVGVVYAIQYGSSQVISFRNFIPDLTDLEILPFFAMITFAFGGLELSSVMAGEIHNPKRNITRSIFISAIVIGILYIVGTIVLLIAIPKGEIGIIEGVAQAFHNIGNKIELPLIGVLGGIFVTLSTIGLFSSWMTGNARLPFVIGLDKYLPSALGKLHPKWGTPYISLLVQGVIITIFFLFSISGSNIKEAYLVLLDMSIILYFIPYLYMFASLIIHNIRNTGNQGGIDAFQKSRFAVWLTTILGFGITLFSILLALIPSKHIENNALFLFKVIGGTVILMAIGLAFYYFKRK